MELLHGSKAPMEYAVQDITAIGEFLEREDIFQLVEQQNDFRWLSRKNPPKYILIDTYSDLTDQVFVHRESGFSFFCNYSDLCHSTEFAQQYECGGLLDAEVLTSLYSELARLLSDRWPKAPIAFISYPTERETRERFIARADALDRAISECCALVPAATRIALDPRLTSSICEEPLLDSFPYHYPPALYQHAAQVVNDALRLTERAI